MGILQKLGQKALSKVPGSLGATAKGKLQTGQVANSLKNQFMTWIAASGQEPTAKTIMSFFTKRKKFSPQLVGRALASLKGMSEATGRIYTRRELDQVILNIAQGAVAGDQGLSIKRSKPSPDLIQKMQTGLTKTIPDQGSPQPTTSATPTQSNLVNKIKSTFTKQQPKQRIEPTFDQPLPRNMPPLTKQAPQSAKFQPSRKAPKMKTKSVTKYK